MKKILIVALFFGYETNFAQEIDIKASEIQAHQISLQQKSKTLIINTSTLSMNVLGELKDELIVWKEKVLSININEQTKEFILVHNYLLSDQELFEVLRKYDIQKKHIISYK